MGRLCVPLNTDLLREGLELPSINVSSVSWHVYRSIPSSIRTGRKKAPSGGVVLGDVVQGTSDVLLVGSRLEQGLVA